MAERTARSDSTRPPTATDNKQKALNMDSRTNGPVQHLNVDRLLGCRFWRRQFHDEQVQPGDQHNRSHQR